MSGEPSIPGVSMKLVSRFLLSAAKRTPRGYYRILKFAAEHDPTLQDITVPLKDIPLSLRADLRQGVFANIYRTGAIPHQRGFDGVCRRLLRPGDLVFDIGANVGYTAALGEEIDVFSTPEELADKIRFYLARPELRAQMIERAYARAAPHYSYAARAKEISSLIKTRLGI